MNPTGKRARKTSGKNKAQLKRSIRQKRGERDDHDAKIGTNARHAAKRKEERERK